MPKIEKIVKGSNFTEVFFEVNISTKLPASEYVLCCVGGVAKAVVIKTAVMIQSPIGTGRWYLEWVYAETWDHKMINGLPSEIMWSGWSDLEATLQEVVPPS